MAISPPRDLLQKSLLPIADGLAILGSYWAANALGHGEFSLSIAGMVLGFLPLCMFIFMRGGLYRSRTDFVSRMNLNRIFRAAALSAVLLAVLLYFFPAPLSIPIVYFALLVISLIILRAGGQAAWVRSKGLKKKHVLIFGAGAAGRQLAQILKLSADYHPNAFIDDDTTLQGKEYEGLKVYPRARLEHLIAQHHIALVLLAIPSAQSIARREIVAYLRDYPIAVKSMPRLSDLIAGRSEIHDLAPVQIEDLLGREVISPIEELLGKQITQKHVCVTGAGGSIGSELCRQILALSPTKLVLFDHTEFALYAIEQELIALAEKHHFHVDIVPVLGSVCNGELVRSTLQTHAIHTIYHAAAYKHVPLVEQNILVGLHNNVFGTQTLVEAAVAASVEAFTLISTDKAVRPTNIMGASKRMAELIVEAKASIPTQTIFSMVRFGNVLGSSGSVIPKFRAQIDAGGPVTVTHPEITRYFMTISEAVQLVIQAGAMAKGGDVFVLDMGEPVKIVDLAERMITLQGFIPYYADQPQGDGNMAIHFSGLRAGEKMYEELLIGNDPLDTAHPKIKTTAKSLLPEVECKALLNDLQLACAAGDLAKIREILHHQEIGYHREISAIA